MAMLIDDLKFSHVFVVVRRSIFLLVMLSSCRACYNSPSKAALNVVKIRYVRVNTTCFCCFMLLYFSCAVAACSELKFDFMRFLRFNQHISLGIRLFRLLYVFFFFYSAVAPAFYVPTLCKSFYPLFCCFWFCANDCSNRL